MTNNIVLYVLLFHFIVSFCLICSVRSASYPVKIKLP